MPRVEWADFEGANLETGYQWIDVPENMDVATQEFRDWAIYQSDPSNSLRPPTLPEITRNLASAQTPTTSTQVIRYSDDMVFANTNNTNNNVSDAESDLEDHSYVVTNTIVVPTTSDTPSYADIATLPPSTNPSPPSSVGGDTFDFDLEDCQRLSDLLDEYHDDPPTVIVGETNRVQTSLILRQSTETSVWEHDDELPDLCDLSHLTAV
jgi:MFS superfamily sulfate permease-like transporter